MIEKDAGPSEPLSVLQIYEQILHERNNLQATFTGQPHDSRSKIWVATPSAEEADLASVIDSLDWTLDLLAAHLRQESREGRPVK